jgi:very-short-patch-repair endonuclease
MACRKTNVNRTGGAGVTPEPGPSGTFPEVLLWKNIKNRALGVEFHRQIPVDDYIVDFYCHELQMVIEIDGTSQYYNCEKDRRKQERLESLGVKVIRIDDLDIKKFINDVIRTLELIVFQRKRELRIV